MRLRDIVLVGIALPLLVAEVLVDRGLTLLLGARDDIEYRRTR